LLVYLFNYNTNAPLIKSTYYTQTGGEYTKNLMVDDRDIARHKLVLED